LALISILGLAAWLLVYSSYAHLSVVQAKRLTVRGKPAVQLLIQTDRGPGREVIVQVGTNKIIFKTDGRGRVDTGHMEIPPGATTVEVRMPEPGDDLWPAECTIPLDQIPQNRYERVTACMDLEPPATRFSQSPEKNRYGWNRSSVEVTLEATDQKSGVKQICYELSGAITQGQRCIQGSQARFPIPASPNGTTTVRFFAEDRWVDQGEPKPNRESAKEERVRIDTGRPSISASRSPEPNEHGWNNEPVRVDFRCSDGLSGIASCSGDRTISSEGASQPVRGYAEDRAGNTNSKTVYVNIDLTKPVIRQAGSATCSQPGNAGWCRGEVTVPFEARDELSGFEDGRHTIQFTRSTSREGESVWVSSGTVEDLAENAADPISAGPFKIDGTPPQITATIDPEPNEHGWNNSPVEVRFRCRDAVSEIASCTPTEKQLTEEGRHTVRAEAADRAGNQAELTVAVNIDKTEPQVNCQVPDTTRWYREDVSVPCTAEDALSGLASAADAEFTLVARGEGEAISTGTRTVADMAGNTATVGPYTFKIDKTPPEIDLSASSPELGEATVTWEITDGLSGVDPGSCLVTISGPGITGVGGRRTLSTDCHGRLTLTYEEYGAGTFTVRAQARDLAGNEGSGETLVPIEPPLGRRVLIYYGNGGAFPGIEEGGARTYQRLKSHYESYDLPTTYTDEWPETLTEFCLIILPTPGTTEDDGSNFYTSSQVDALGAFLRTGGRLLVLGDHSGVFGINTVNDLLAKLGVGISQNADVFLSGLDSAPTTNITPDPLTDGVTSLQFAASSSLNMSGTAKSLAREPGGATLIAVDRGAGGEVVVSGDSNFIDDAWFSDGDGDNLRFIDNLVAGCTGG
jgi:hypothetical protein